MHVDHRIARSAGGTDALSNVVATHRLCNQRKGTGYVVPDAPRSVTALPVAPMQSGEHEHGRGRREHGERRIDGEVDAG